MGNEKNRDCIIVLAQIGVPKSPKKDDVKNFLKEFLGHPQISSVNRFFWAFLLHCVILPFYTKKSVRKYQVVWDGNSFLTHKLTEQFKERFSRKEEKNDVFLFFSFMENKLSEKKNHILVPLFPQFSLSTYGLLDDEFSKLGLPYKIISSYYREEFFLKSCQKQILQNVSEFLPIDALLLTFHSIPMKQIQVRNDSYFDECQMTFFELQKRLSHYSYLGEIILAFHSRWGKGKWCGPELCEVVLELQKKKYKRVAIFSPSFVIDGLETIYDLSIELKAQMASFGIEIFLIPSVGECDDFIDGLVRYVRK